MASRAAMASRTGRRAASWSGVSSEPAGRAPRGPAGRPARGRRGRSRTSARSRPRRTSPAIAAAPWRSAGPAAGTPSGTVGLPGPGAWRAAMRGPSAAVRVRRQLGQRGPLTGTERPPGGPFARGEHRRRPPPRLPSATAAARSAAPPRPPGASTSARPAPRPRAGAAGAAGPPGPPGRPGPAPAGRAPPARPGGPAPRAAARAPAGASRASPAGVTSATSSTFSRRPGGSIARMTTASGAR